MLSESTFVEFPDFYLVILGIVGCLFAIIGFIRDARKEIKDEPNEFWKNIRIGIYTFISISSIILIGYVFINRMLFIPIDNDLQRIRNERIVQELPGTYQGDLINEIGNNFILFRIDSVFEINNEFHFDYNYDVYYSGEIRNYFGLGKIHFNKTQIYLDQFGFLTYKVHDVNRVSLTSSSKGLNYISIKK